MQYESVIVGAGISGLCAAFYLSRRYSPESVCLLEAAPAAGGFVRTDDGDGFLCDWGPNGFLDREPKMLEWIADLQLTDALVPSNQAAARRFIVKGGALKELVPPPAFLLSDILSIQGRGRLLMEPFIAQRTDPAPESIHAFATRRIGREAADMLVAPMVTGVFGGDAKQLSLTHCFPRMAAMEADHGGLFKAMRAKAKAARQSGTKSGSPMGPGGTLTTLRDGIGALATRAADVLHESIRFNWPAARIERRDGVFAVISESGHVVEARRVVLATPIHVTAKLIEGFAPDAAKRLAATACCNMSVVISAFPRAAVGHDLDGFGFLIPRSEGIRALGCIWTSSVFPHQSKPDHVLLRTMIGGSTDPTAVDLGDEETLDIVRREIYPIVRAGGDPVFTRIYRHRNAIPQYGLTHGDTLAAVDGVEEQHPGLAFAGNGYRGVGLNDCVVSALRAVDTVSAQS